MAVLKSGYIALQGDTACECRSEVYRAEVMLKGAPVTRTALPSEVAQ